MQEEKAHEVEIFFKNTLDTSVVIAAVKEQDGLHFKFLTNLRDYVGYSPYVMNPGDKVSIKYTLYKEELKKV